MKKEDSNLLGNPLFSPNRVNEKLKKVKALLGLENLWNLGSVF